MKTKNSTLMKAIPFTNVKIEDQFWAPKLEINRTKTIPYEFKQCKETGRIDAFKLDWKPGIEPMPHYFWDSDVAKWIEAASYSLATNPDPELDALLDSVLELIASAQQPDGYLNVYFTVVEPERRWKDLRDAHELYCAGHLMEAGVAHFQATGKRNFLDVVCRYADYIDRVFGAEEGKLKGYPGHQEIELALVKLYRVTGEERYLRLSQFFIDERGKQPHYFELEKKESKGAAEDFMNTHKDKNAYNQSHLPVREQSKVVGHAVRALYMYCAMADLAGELNDPTLLEACERLWDNLHNKNMYITGGIGSTRNNEGFTFDYDLPNETAYAETCASVAVVFWNHRLLQLNCDGKYADSMERALYNGVLSGISLDGEKFFYANPLASLGDTHRSDWFGCACCPPNIARLLASLGEYIYSFTQNEVITHLYVKGSAEFEIDNTAVTLKQDTNYPWDGTVNINFEVERPVSFGLKLRIPGWCREARLYVNGEQQEIQVNKGYVRIEKEWSNEDQVELFLSMPADRFYSNPNVRQNVNHVALQRGPLVYCLESVDNTENLNRIVLPKENEMEWVFDEQQLGGVVTLSGEAYLLNNEEWEGKLYNNAKPQQTPITITAVPYYAWDNREEGQMLVWINEG